MSAVSYRYFPPEDIRKDPKKFVEGARDFIRKYMTSQDRVEDLVSGGVDSSVTTAIFCLEAEDRLFVSHVDTGFMRIIRGREEPEIVAERFSGLENFEFTYARKLFYGHVFGISDAEKKRKAFQEAYREIADELISIHKCNAITHGTIYPDIKETLVIKTQHNVDVPFRRVKKVIEPLASLRKNDVRRVAEYLFETYGFKFLRNVSRRQPFPGPGLAVRTIGAIDLDKLNTEKQANDMVEQAVDRYAEKLFGCNMYIDPETEEQVPFQSFAATFDNKFKRMPHEMREKIENFLRRNNLPTKVKLRILATPTTGTKGGKRVYSFPLCIESEELMGLDYESLRKIGNEIPLLTGLSRVLYKVSYGDKEAPYLISIRSVRSVDAITAKVFEIPLDYLQEVGKGIAKKCKCEGVYWDISDKPPATIENE